MPLPVPQPRIAREEYAAFAALLKSDKDFPSTHDGWLERCAKERDKYSKQGKRLNLIDVHVQKFADFCRDRAQRPSLYMLGVFTSEQTRNS